MSATIVNETTYTVWCSECPYSTDPTIYREQAERWAAEHDAEKHADEVPQDDSYRSSVLRDMKYGRR